MTKKLKIRIDGMHCTSCSMVIDGDLEDTKGVVAAYTNYARGETEVEYKENEITLSEIVSIIEKTGYKATS